MTDVSVRKPPVSGRHVGAHPDGHQHGVSIQISPYILHKKNCGLNIGENLCILTFFLFSDSGLNLLNGFDFYFEWRDTENQQYETGITTEFVGFIPQSLVLRSIV